MRRCRRGSLDARGTRARRGAARTNSSRRTAADWCSAVCAQQGPFAVSPPMKNGGSSYYTYIDIGISGEIAIFRKVARNHVSHQAQRQYVTSSGRQSGLASVPQLAQPSNKRRERFDPQPKDFCENWEALRRREPVPRDYPHNFRLRLCICEGVIELRHQPVVILLLYAPRARCVPIGSSMGSDRNTL